MSDEVDIKFFKNEKSGSVRLGGGFITSGILKTNFSVFKNDKNRKYGFNISLPYRKQDDGTIVNEVSFVNAQISDEVYDKIKNLLDGKSDPAPRVVTESMAVSKAGPATSVDIKAGMKKFDKKALPF